VERVLVVGAPGAGKSTVAAAIGRHAALPVVHLDQHYFRPGWVEPPQDEWRRTVEGLAGGRKWVIDGNYGSTLDLTFGRADTVVWLDLPTWLCLWRISRRVLRHRGEVRPDMAPGCPERLEWDFFAYTATFRRRKRNRIVDRLPGFTGRLVHLRRRGQVERFLRSL
jgi:adenylate kinase family enzyme